MSFIRIYRIILRIIFTIFERPLRYKMVKDLERAGVTVNGDKAHDPKVTNGKVFPVTGYKGLVGLGEAYMDSWWDCERLDEFWTKVLRAGLIKKIMHRGERFAMYFKYDLFGGHTRRRAAESGSKAQEIGELQSDKTVYAGPYITCTLNQLNLQVTLCFNHSWTLT